MSDNAKDLKIIQDRLKSLTPYNPQWRLVGNSNHTEETCGHIAEGSSCSIGDSSDDDVVPAVEVTLANNMGRQLVTTRDLEAGELLFCEPALLNIVPSQGDSVICVSCLQDLANDFPSCPGCGSPKCLTQCTGDDAANDPHTPEECQILSKYGFTDKLTVKEKLSMIRTFNALITPLRVLKEIATSPLKADLFWAFEDNVAKRKNIPNGLEKEYKVATLMQEQLQLDIETNKLIRIWGIYESNSFEVPLSDNQRHRGCALFSTICMMNHSCTFNAQVAFFDGIAHVWTTQDIPSGTPVTINYTQPFLGTTARRLSLAKSKLFCCQCSRCTDPTELGSHISSIKCMKCNTGLLVPPVQQRDPWTCYSCENSIPFSTIEILSNATTTFMAKVDKNNISSLKKTLAMMEKHLGAQNSTCVELRHHLVTRLMREPLQDLSAEVLWSLIDMTQSLLDVVNQIAPGKSFIRGNIILHQARACYELLFRKHCDKDEETTDTLVNEINIKKCPDENKNICESSRFSRVILSEREVEPVLYKNRNVDEINIPELLQQIQESRKILLGERKKPKDTRVIEIFLSRLLQKQNESMSICTESKKAHKIELTDI